MSDGNAARVRRQRRALVGVVLGVLLVLLGALIFRSWREAEDVPNDARDGGDDAASAAVRIVASDAAAVLGARDAGGDVFFAGKFSAVIAVNRDERTVLVLLENDRNAPDQQVYFVVHMDGRTEDVLALSSRGYERTTEDPSALNTQESRATLARLEALARRFHLLGKWLPYLAFGEPGGIFPSIAHPLTWRLRFDEDGGAEIDTRQTAWSWVRTAGSSDFVRRPRAPEEPPRATEGLPVISYEFDTRRTAQDSEGTGDTCFFWEAPSVARRPLWREIHDCDDVAWEPYALAYGPIRDRMCEALRAHGRRRPPAAGPWRAREGGAGLEGRRRERGRHGRERGRSRVDAIGEGVDAVVECVRG